MRRQSFLMCCLLVCSLPVQIATAVDDTTMDRGREIYASKCAVCHGAEGEGVAGGFESPLAGDLPLEGLIQLVSETMPEDDPEACVADEAKAVATFIHQNFYSASARHRGNQARIQLTRRTARQFRESVADLIAAFDDPLWIPEERGLRANYFASSNWNEKRRLAKQIDPNLEFGNGVEHFRADGKYEGVEEIKKENKMGDGFAIFWSGGIIAPESGEYEFTAHCRNGFRLWVNDPESPLIDRWVRSNDELTHRQSIHLRGGRVYTFNLNLFQYEEPDVQIRVEWKTPSGIREVIPPDAFVPHGAREGLVVAEPFPADDASDGYERGISISQQWDEATTAAAIEAANWIAARIDRLSGTKDTDDDRLEKIRGYCVSFVEKAFVSPLSEADKTSFVLQHFEKELSIPDQVKRVVILALKSPRFLYPSVAQREENYELAARTALVFLDSVPDKTLFAKAAEGHLTDDDQLKQQMYRLLVDSRSKQKVLEFFHYWLQTTRVADATKDPETFPGFDSKLIRELGRSLDLLLEEIVWSENSDFRELFLADYLIVNQRIASYYELDIDHIGEPMFEGFKKVQVDPVQRAGILTHPYLMTGLAYHKDSSPIHRGVFVARRLLGRQLRPPPGAVEPLAEEFDITMTTRQRVEHQTKAKACMSCHSVINPLGFSLENFDAVGRFRTEEKDKPIDVSSVYTYSNGTSVQFTGPRDLAEYLATNEAAQRSFVRQLFQHYAKQPINAYGDDCLDKLHQNFLENNFNIKQLILDIAWVIVQHGYD